MDMDWVEAERLPFDDCDPKALLTKWANVAEDVALIPGKNVRMRTEAGHFVVEVSRELYDCFSGS